MLSDRQELVLRKVVEEYLAGEETAEMKHEYLDGVVYAMAGATNAHNRLAVNVIASLHAQLRGQRRQPGLAPGHQDHAMPSPGQLFRDLGSDARGGPGDERGGRGGGGRERHARG